MGRRLELADLAGLLATRRLVTVVGPPGSGKTRLAVEASSRSIEDYPHGVFFVSLAEVEQPDLIASAIADAVGVSAIDRPVLEALIDHAKTRRLLLVLDNFEHLLGGAPVVGTSWTPPQVSRCSPRVERPSSFPESRNTGCFPCRSRKRES